MKSERSNEQKLIDIMFQMVLEERIDLRCKQEALREDGSKIMEFTEGDIYTFVRSIDPEGWEVLDDNLNKEVFFNPFIMFEEIKGENWCGARANSPNEPCFYPNCKCNKL